MSTNCIFISALRVSYSYITFCFLKAQGSFQKRYREVVDEGIDDYKETVFSGYDMVLAHIENVTHVQDLCKVKPNQTLSRREVEVPTSSRGGICN